MTRAFTLKEFGYVLPVGAFTDEFTDWAGAGDAPRTWSITDPDVQAAQACLDSLG